VKVARTVLKGERGGNAADLLNPIKNKFYIMHTSKACGFHKKQFQLRKKTA